MYVAQRLQSIIKKYKNEFFIKFYGKGNSCKNRIRNSWLFRYKRKTFLGKTNFLKKAKHFDLPYMYRSTKFKINASK